MNQDKELQGNVRTERDTSPATPLWVKVIGVIIAVLIVLFIGLQLFGGSRHGPGRHLPSSNTPAIENDGQ